MDRAEKVEEWRTCLNVERFNGTEEGRIELKFSEQDFWRTQHFIFGLNT